MGLSILIHFIFFFADPIYEEELPPIKPSIHRLMSSKKASRKANKFGKILPESRTLMEKFFAPFNQQLAELLEDDRFAWK